MPDYSYLIIGGGMTSDAAVEGIRQVDKDGSIGVVSLDVDPPYDRPPLSKALWTGKKEEGDIFRGTEDKQAELHLGRRATSLDPDNSAVTDDQGQTYHYEKLLLATGGTPRKLPFDGEDVIYFRSFQDYRRLRKLVDERETFAVIGGGFIGSEIAAALAMNGKHVSMIFPEEGIGGRQFPVELARFLNDYYSEKGVDVIAGELVEGYELDRGKALLTTRSGRAISADGVVAGLGIRPNTALAEGAGLEAGDGIVVNAALQTSHPNIYAAGDVAAFHNPALDRRLRVEHEDNANTMGRLAGRSMAGEPVEYDHLPFFYSDLFDLGYEAVGDLDPVLELVQDWQEPHRKGVVYYMKAGRVRGVLLWDVWGKVEEATALIASPGPFSEDDLRGRL